ncbi:alpha-2,8-sialyltransferase 8F-like isoform X2 [Paramisgurnus dabryanus]|uniref:alpha-2,8-sialyltransferase 8F-like isoform X2 n=1 Tax=Paramisgurnus dabryanus TaxID=90735 RepID=UPI0031F33F8F
MDRFMKRIFALLAVIVLIFTIAVFYDKINTTTREIHVIPPVYCMQLRHKFANIASATNPAQFDFKNFTEDLSALMRCPPMSNITQKELNRARLRACCNATGILYYNKQNTAANQNITYETSSKQSYHINKDFYNMLPEDFPWSGRTLSNCAVVGSGGILKNSSCGREIDTADFVIRFNMAPVNDSDVGLKTDLVTMNPSQLLGYKNLKSNPGPLVERVSVYGNSILIISAFNYAANTRLSVNAFKVLHPIRPQQHMVFFSSSYMKNLSGFWKRQGLKGVHLSSGFRLINVALEVCDHVHVYGFWPFDTNLEQQKLTHHYFDNVGPKRGVHAMPKEFLNLLKLHSQGALTLHLQPCL